MYLIFYSLNVSYVDCYHITQFCTLEDSISLNLFYSLSKLSLSFSRFPLFLILLLFLHFFSIPLHSLSFYLFSIPLHSLSFPFHLFPFLLFLFLHLPGIIISKMLNHSSQKNFLFCLSAINAI